MIKIERTSDRLRPSNNNNNTDDPIHNKKDGDVEGKGSDAGLSFVVGKHHSDVVCLVFNSTKCINQRCMDSSSMAWKRWKKKSNGVNGHNPRCTNDHEMAVTALSIIADHRIRTTGRFLCDQCDGLPSHDKSKGSRGWFCDSCNYHVCFVCSPERKGSTQYLVLHGPENESLSVMPAEIPHVTTTTGQGASTHDQTTTSPPPYHTLRHGSIVEVNNPSTVPISCFSVMQFAELSSIETLASQYYRLTDATGFVDRIPESAWHWQLIPVPSVTQHTHRRPLFSSSSSPSLDMDVLQSSNTFPHGRGTSSSSSSSSSSSPFPSSREKNSPSNVPSFTSTVPERIEKSSPINHPTRQLPVHYLQPVDIVDLIDCTIRLDRGRKDALRLSQAQSEANNNPCPDDMKRAVVVLPDVMSLLKEYLECALAVFDQVRKMCYNLRPLIIPS